MKENPLASASFWGCVHCQKLQWVVLHIESKCFQCFTHFWIFFPAWILKLLQEWLSAPSLLFTALGMRIVFLTRRAVDPQGCMLRCSASIWAVLREARAQSLPWTALGVVQQALRRENSSHQSQVSACLWSEAADLYLTVSSWGSFLPNTPLWSWQCEVRVC